MNTILFFPNLAAGKWLISRWLKVATVEEAAQRAHLAVRDSLSQHVPHSTGARSLDAFLGARPAGP